MSHSIKSPFEGKSFSEILRSRAHLHPKDVAFRFIGPNTPGRDILCYEELLEMAQVAAAELMRTTPAGQPVMLVLPPSLELVIAFFGALLAQRTVAIVAPPRKSRDERMILQRIDSLRPVTVVVVSDSDSFAQTMALSAEHLCTISRLLTGAPATNDAKDDPRRVAIIQYTSGSTSAPAACQITNANLIYSSRRIYHAFAHTRKSIGLVWTPPYHDMGLVGGILQPVYGGFQTLLMAPHDFLRNPLSWIRAISDHRVTTSGGPDFAYELCVRSAEGQNLRDLDLNSWTVAYNGAESVRAVTLNRFAQVFRRYGFRKKAFLPCYGLAEATLMVTGTPISRTPTEVSTATLFSDDRSAHAPAKAGPGRRIGCGYPDSETIVLVVDPETHVPCRPRQVGEIWVQGPGVAAGYSDDEVKTRNTFDARLEHSDIGPFLRTGDLGIFYKHELFIVGRRKDLIILNGVNYHPEDMEQVAAAASGLLRAGAVAAFSAERPGGEQLVLIAEVDERLSTEKLDGIIEAVLIRLQHDFERVPQSIVLVGTGRIPRTQSGKIQRAKCRDQFLSDELSPLRHKYFDHSLLIGKAHMDELNLDMVPTEGLSNLLPAERRELIACRIEAWLRAGLHLDQPVLRDVNVAVYGIDSVIATRLAEYLGSWLKLPLTNMLLWNYPSVDALSEYLSNLPLQEEWNSTEHAPLLAPTLIPDPAIDQAPAGDALVAAISNDSIASPPNSDRNMFQTPAGLPRAQRGTQERPVSREERLARMHKRRDLWLTFLEARRLKLSGKTSRPASPLTKVIARDWTVEMISTYVDSYGRRSYIDQPLSLTTPVPARPLVDVDRFRLTPADIELFYRQGYLGPFRLMTADEARTLGNQILAHMATPSQVYGFPSVRDRHLDLPALAELFRRPEIIERIAQLLGPELICWRSQLFYKEPSDPAIEWHQASTYLLEDRVSPILRPTDPTRLFQLTVWIAFGDADEENGCLEVFPGSHHRIRTVRASNASGFYNAKYVLEMEEGIGRPVKLPVKAGEFLIFTERTVHGSGPNRSNRPRFGLNFRVVSPNVTIYQWKTEQRTVHQPDGRPLIYNLAKWRPMVLRTS